MLISHEHTQILWASSLAAIPMALLVALCCRCFVRRPATRHALWLIVLVSFLTPSLGLVIGLPRLTDPIAMLVTGVEDPPDGHELAEAESEQAPEVTLSPPERSTQSNEPSRDVSLPSAALTRGSDAPAADPRPDRLTRTRRDDQLIAASDRRLDRPTPTAPIRLESREAAPPATALTASEIDIPPIERNLLAIRTPDQFETARRNPIDPADAAQPIEETAGLHPESEGAIDAASPTEQQTASSDWGLWMQRVVAARDAVAAIPAPPPTFWLVGISVIVGLGSLRLIMRGGLVRRATPAPASVQRMVDDASALVGLPSAPRTLMSHSRISPMISCGLRPRLILPTDLWDAFDHDSRQAVLVHELAHLRRRDHWVCWIEILISAVYWWHPVAWWTRRRIREEADLSCDMWVTTLLPGCRRAYAEALVQTKSFLNCPGRRTPIAGIGMASARTRRFARRLTMVMTERVGPRLSPIGGLLTVGAAAAGMLVMPALACPEKDKKSKVSPSVFVSPAEPETPAPYPGSGPFGNLEAPAADGVPGPGPASPFAVVTPATPTIYGQNPVAAPTFSAYVGAAGSQPEDRLHHLEERLTRLEHMLEALVGHLEEAEWEGNDHDHDDHDEWDDHDHDHDDEWHEHDHDEWEHEHEGNGESPWWSRERGGNLMEEIGNPGEGADVFTRTYAIPSGRLRSVTNLMVRQDVPILVDPNHDGVLIVYGTEKQHWVFEAFMQMIAPGEVEVDGRKVSLGQSEEHQEAFDFERRHDDIWVEVKQRRGAAEEHMAHAEAIMEEARHMARRADELAVEAEHCAEKADRMRDEADELRDKARESNRRNRERLMVKAEQCEVEAATYAARAEELEAAAEDCSAHAEHLEIEAEEHEDIAEQLADEAEDLEWEIEEAGGSR